MPNPALAAMAQRIVALFDTAQAPAGPLVHVLDPATGAITTRRGADGQAVEDGELDLEELDLSMICFASDQPLDAIAFLRQVDQDGNGRLAPAELAGLLGSMEPVEQESLALQLDVLERLDAEFEAARAKAEAASVLTRWASYRALREADGQLATARRRFVESLVAYARPGIG